MSPPSLFVRSTQKIRYDAILYIGSVLRGERIRILVLDEHSRGCMAISRGIIPQAISILIDSTEKHNNLIIGNIKIESSEIYITICQFYDKIEICRMICISINFLSIISIYLISVILSGSQKMTSATVV